MYILELIIALQANDFWVPPDDQVSDAVNQAHQCQLALGYQADCVHVIEKLVHTKYKPGGVYANYQ